MRTDKRMPVGIARRIILWHPGVLTAVFVFSLVAQLGGSGMQLPPAANGILLSLPIAAMCGWLWAIFHVSRHASVVAMSSYKEWVFAIPPIVALMAGLAGWSTDNSPAAFAMFLSLFVGLFWTAGTLENVDAPTGSASIGRILGTGLLMYLAPIGVWVLHTKIVRVASKPDLRRSLP